MPMMAPAISLARLGGIKTGLITKRRFRKRRASAPAILKLEYVYQGVR